MPLTLFDMLTADAFSSLWYWVILALVLSRATYAPLGVPMEIYEHAARQNNTAEDALAVIRLGVARQVGLWSKNGVWLIGGWAFLISGLLILSVFYRNELAQAVLFLVVPVGIIQVITLRTAHRMWGMKADVVTLVAMITRLRRWTQFVALTAIFVTALYGMLFNLHNALF